MKRLTNYAVMAVMILLSTTSIAQNTRLNDYNKVGWYAATGTFSFNSKWSAHLEYQWRRENYVKTWQQSLLRTGINYHANSNTTLRFGYAWAETYDYGDYPLNVYGKTFTEHRLYEVATLTQRSGTFDITHRIKLEQRWLPRYASAASIKPDDWMYMNRARYMLRVQQSLKGKTLEDKEPYIAAYDEIFIGFGKNVNENIFDQNRVGLLLGYRFSKHFRLEGGYINQVVQLGREVNGRNVFQRNNGFILSSVMNVNL
nr:DUF2490 domain-containing protein [uncultured Lacibacter sp.]